MTIKTSFNVSTAIECRLAALRHVAAAGRIRHPVVGLRRWLLARWLDRNRARLALLELDGEHLSEFGRQTQRDIRRELSDRARIR